MARLEREVRAGPPHLTDQLETSRGIYAELQGTGFARGFSASQVSFARRGLEKLIFKLTFFVVATFILGSVLSFLI